MSITAKTITNTDNEILSTANTKMQLRIESSYTDEDTLIDSYVEAAVNAAESYINGHIQAKTMVIKLDEMPDSLQFSTHPVRAVSSITYYDTDNSEQTLVAGTDYHVETPTDKECKIVFDNTYNTYDRPDAVTVTATIGYANAAAVPAPVIQAIKLMVSDMYERREDRANINYKASSALLQPYRKYL